MLSPMPCGLCGSSDRAVISDRDAKSKQRLPIMLCNQCGFVQQSEVPSEDELRIYYSHHYREDYKNTYNPKLKHVHRAGYAACERLGLLQTHLGDTSNLELLDIGAGGGEFVYLANRFGFEASGIEPNQGYSEFARHAYEVSVITSMVQDLDVGSTDVITLFHVLEHMADPKAVMARLWDVLRPNGKLFIEVPNILQSDASPANIFFKAHLHYFSRFTLTAAASRYFTVVTIEDRGNLKMLLARRDTPLADCILPTEQEVAYTTARLEAKGWLEYITVGGGWIKPFRKLASMAHERALSGDARSVLDGIYDKRLKSEFS